MSYRSYICLIAFFLGWFNNLKAQEQEFLDDSTHDVHGLHTTFFLTPADLKYNISGFKPLSVNIEKIDRFTFRQKMAYKVQDLGNEGTATKSIFYTLPQAIGAHSGFYVYDVYFRDPSHQRYYDTKAPYTDGTVVFANYGSYSFEGCHARSFNKNWHLGAMFETIMSDREYIPSKIPYDRQVITYPFTLFGHYKTDNERYQLLVSFYRKEHRNRDTGGISGEDNKVDKWLEAKAIINNNLSPADSVESGELRQQYYLYHQAVYAEPLQVYQEIMVRNTNNYFKTRTLNTKSKAFLAGNLLNKLDSIEDSTTMQTFSNECGIKGKINRIFYQYYTREKLIKLEKINLLKRVLAEYYLGLYTRINVRDNIDFIHLHGEYLQGDFYKIHTSYKGSILELSYDQVKYRPSFLSLRYESVYRNWNKNFKPPVGRQLEGSCRIPLPGVLVKPYGRFVHIQSPIYFRHVESAGTVNALIEPHQEKEHAHIITWGANINISLLSYFHLDTEVASTQVAGPASNAFRIPKWYTNVRTYYAKTFYKGKSEIETGIECNWKSSYHADGYDPITQQFYRQDDFNVYSYPIIELFFNFRIKTFRGFLKVVHANQGLLSKPGYFVTPFYPGQLRSIDLGFSWSLFN
ncbi:MAG: putative porin [Candidatus Amoebophilus sp.]